MNREIYLDLFSNNLKRYFTSLYLELEELFELKFSPEVDLLDFTIVESVDGTSIMVYCMDINGEEVYGSYGDHCFSGSEKLLENVGLFSFGEEFDRNLFFYDNPEMEHEELELLENWFMEAYKKGGGEEFKLPCFFGIADDIKSFDLRKRKWVLNGSEKFVFNI